MAAETLGAYDPSKSETHAGAIADFITAPVTEDIEMVPGVGPANARLLAEDGIETTHQLIGKFFMFSSKGSSTRERCDEFYLWLKSIKVNSSRQTIVRAIAEKANALVDGLYNEEEL